MKAGLGYFDNKPRMPFEVSEEFLDQDFNEFNDVSTIAYFRGDGIFIDEEDRIIFDPDILLGEIVLRRLPRELKPIIYVCNDSYDLVLEVLIINDISPYTKMAFDQ